jgi:hypothetical protein
LLAEGIEERQIGACTAGENECRESSEPASVWENAQPQMTRAIPLSVKD